MEVMMEEVEKEVGVKAGGVRVELQVVIMEDVAVE